MVLIIRIFGVTLTAYYAYQCYLIGGKDIPLSYFGGLMAGFALMGAPMEIESIFKALLGWVSTFTGILLVVNSKGPDDVFIILYFVLGNIFYFIGLSLLGFENGYTSYDVD